MNRKVKPACFAGLTLTLLLLSSGLFSIHCDQARAQSSNVETEAYACLTAVLNVDFNHYNVSAPETLSLPTAPNDTSVTEQVSYNLTSADSNIVVVFLFRDDVLYQLAQRTISGSVVVARNFTNVNDAAVDFLSRYESVTPVDLTPLVKLVQMLNGTMGKTASAGNLTLCADSWPVSPGHTLTSFFFHCITDNASVSLGFDNGVFYNFEYFGFTAQDSAAALAALRTSTPSPSPTPTTSPLNLSTSPVSSTTPITAQQESQGSQTLILMALVLAAVILTVGFIMIAALKKGSKQNGAA